MDKEKPELHAYAKQIEYFPEQHLIHLIGHARIEQGQNSFAAQNIRYDTLTQKVVTTSPQKSRTLIVFHTDDKNSLQKLPQKPHDEAPSGATS